MKRKPITLRRSNFWIGIVKATSMRSLIIIIMLFVLGCNSTERKKIQVFKPTTDNVIIYSLNKVDVYISIDSVLQTCQTITGLDKQNTLEFCEFVNKHSDSRVRINDSLSVKLKKQYNYEYNYRFQIGASLFLENFLESHTISIYSKSEKDFIDIIFIERETDDLGNLFFKCFFENDTCFYKRQVRFGL